MNLQALQKALDKAKIGVMIHGSVFISTVAFSCKHSFNEDIPTAGTNGKEIIYNPKFFEALSPAQRIALIAHEAWHVALMHMLRGADLDKAVYNMAGDYVINQLLVDDNFELPPGGLQDNRFRNMSTKQVYDVLIDEGHSGENADKDIIYVIPGAEGEDGKQLSAEELEADIKQVLVKANTQSKIHGEQAGSIPGEIERALDELLNPRLPWNVLLERFLTEKVKDDYSWNRPNKRFMPDFYLPTQYSESLQHLTFAIDTSGSICDDDLQKILSEIQSVRDLFKPKKMTILDCDSRIHNVYTIEEDTHVLDLQFSGGGGTSCFPVFKYLEDNPTAALIYFTDLYMTNYNKEVDFPVLWVVYDNPTAKVEVGEIVHYDM